MSTYYFDDTPFPKTFFKSYSVMQPLHKHKACRGAIGRGRGSFTSEGGFTSSVIPKYVGKVQGDKLDHKVDLHSYHSENQYKTWMFQEVKLVYMQSIY